MTIINENENRKKNLLSVLIFLLLSLIIGYFSIDKTFKVGATYRNGKKEGVETVYYDGNVSIKTTYKNGKKNGPERYYRSFNLLRETSFTEDEKDGIEKEFYDDGNLKSEVSYKNGRFDGLSQTYYNNGNLKSSGHFKDGQKKGIWKSYFKDGEIENEEYISENSDAFKRNYYSNGKLKAEIFFYKKKAILGYNYDNLGQRSKMTNAHLYNQTKYFNQLDEGNISFSSNREDFSYNDLEFLKNIIQQMPYYKNILKKENLSKNEEDLFVTYLAFKCQFLMTPEELNKLYSDEKDKIKLESEEEVRARHILVSTQNEAISLINKLEKGEDFVNLANKYSLDSNPNIDNGGDLGYFTKDMMIPEFANPVFKIDQGKFSKEPIKTPFGWHVVKVEDRRKIKIENIEIIKIKFVEKFLLNM